jgi:hypothetical protein
MKPCLKRSTEKANKREANIRMHLIGYGGLCLLSPTDDAGC